MRQYSMRTRLLTGLLLVLLLVELSPSFALVSQTSSEVSSHGALSAPLPAGTIRLGATHRSVSLHTWQPALASATFVALAHPVEFLAQPSLRLHCSVKSLLSS